LLVTDSVVGGRVVMKEQCGACSNFLLRSGILHNWFQWCLRADELFSDSLHGWVLEFFQQFLAFCWRLVTLNIRHLQLTLDQPWNVNAIRKPLSGLKNVLQKPHNAFQRFSSWFAELRTKLDADTLLDFAIHHRQNETWSQKSTRIKIVCVHSAVSRGRLMQ
jgi:hypothetical protein